MSQLKLNMDLLDVLLAVSYKKKLSIIESHCDGFESDWYQVVRKYYFSLPNSLLDEVGLKKNERCVRAVINFKVPCFWSTLESNALSEFSFSY